MNLGVAICVAALVLGGSIIIHAGDQTGGVLIGIGVLAAIVGMLAAS